MKPGMHTLRRAATAGLLAAGLCLGTGPSAAAPGPWEDAARLLETAAAFVRARLGDDGDVSVRLGRLDRRLRLRRCDGRLQAFWPHGRRPRTGHASVGVRCLGGVRWKIYLPVRIRRYAQVVVAARALPAGHVLSAADLKRTRLEVDGLRSYHREPRRLDGMVLRRALAAGQPVEAVHVSPPVLVRRGQRIVVEARAGGLAVRAAGVALADGRKGDTIRVRNLRSKRVVQAVVTGRGRVEVVL